MKLDRKLTQTRSTSQDLPQPAAPIEVLTERELQAIAGGRTHDYVYVSRPVWEGGWEYHI